MALAVGLVVVGLVAATGGDYYDHAEIYFALTLIPLLCLAAARPTPFRPYLIAAAALLASMWSPGLETLWLSAIGLTFLAVLLDPSDAPYAGWVAPAVGVTMSLVVYGRPDMAPFLVLTIAVGGGAALLVRSLGRTAELSDEAEGLREQTTWLEQRTAVARELHDVVGHQVTAMVVQAEAGRIGDPHEALRAIGDLGRTALAELDSLVVHLRDPGAPLTVSAPPRLLDIDELLGEPLRTAGLEVDVRLGADLALDDSDVLTVYRVAQEALTNVARHASARRVWVDVVRKDGAVRLRVSDDGVGLPAERGRGSGLLGIEERVAARGGAMEVTDRPGGGTMLDVTLPLDAP
jgi:signal transduction histidine kinase